MIRSLKFILLSIFILTICNKLTAQESQHDSVYVHGKNYEFYDSTLIASNKAIGGNLFLGEGFWKGNISEYFSNQFLIGLNIDIYRSKFIIQIDDYIGTGKVKQTMTFPGQLEWKKDKAGSSCMFGCNLGYSIVDTKNLRFAPIGGIGGNLLTSSLMSSSINENYKNEPFLPYYKLGFFIDLKSLTLLQERTRINNIDEKYTSLRLSFGVNQPIGKPKYSDYYNGSMIYFTIGIGEFSRKFKYRY